MNIEQKVSALVNLGWSPEGAYFLATHNLSSHWNRRLFGMPTRTDPRPKQCPRCGYYGIAIDAHHTYGRKVSNEIEWLCANCHREVHAGARVIK